MEGVLMYSMVFQSGEDSEHLFIYRTVRSNLREKNHYFVKLMYIHI